ncbi:MAG: class I SAM-dependent methyltransferase, partial [Bdellovibrionales bacterium]|nr:class I SAM-dependent methyltransferase [Bdellovibrionales bacterium]
KERIDSDNSILTDNSQSFDLVLAMGVFHHLDKESAEDLTSTAYQALKKGGVFLTGDPYFEDNSNGLESFLANNDRGQFMRKGDDLKTVINSKFSDVNIFRPKNLGFLPVRTLITKSCK